MNAQIKELAEKFKACQDENKRILSLTKTNDESWKSIEEQLLEAMVEEGVNSAEFEGIGKVMIRTKNYPNVTNADKELFIAYLDEIGQSELVKRDVAKTVVGEFLDPHIEELIQKCMADTDVGLGDARRAVLAFLKTKGVSTFTSRDIAPIK